MVCIYCGANTQVTNSRPQKRLNQVWRRRQCLQCKAVFTTQEAADYTTAWTVRGKSGILRPFSRDKLFLSLHSSCQHRPTALSDAAALTDTVIKKLLTAVEGGSVDCRVISQLAQVSLNRFDKAASVHYQAFHRS